MLNLYQYFVSKRRVRVLPNSWDGVALILIMGLLGLFAWAAKQMSTPYQIGQALPISLDPSHLPTYALLTISRMLVAMLLSLLFTFTVGTWAAKNRRAQQLIIPCIDILQSVPVLGFLSITVTGFIALFPGSRLGPECAVIFAIFTAQVWNMVLGFYQSLRTVPLELKDAADMFHLSAWHRFWRIEVPFAMPGLLWNMMLSMSGSWIFIVASEAISVSNQQITLPGIGSYLGLAIAQANFHAVLYTIITVLVVILLYDQLLFRPLLVWADKFKAEQVAREKAMTSWVSMLFLRTNLLPHIKNFFGPIIDYLLTLHIFVRKPNNIEMVKAPSPALALILNIAWYCFLFILVITSLTALGHYIYIHVPLADLKQVFWLGGATALRIFTVLLISTLIWVPVGVWIGLRPKSAQIVQPLAQFLAAFPMNVLFPIVVLTIIRFHLNVNIWVTPLILLGSQWYILFNVIAGAAALPKDLRQVADNFGIHGWKWWKRLILPGIFPYYITGAITALGNAWNTTVIAEVVSWGSTTLTASGLGAYITQNTNSGDFPRVALGMGMMSIFVLVLNRLLWRPLYNLAQSRFRLD